MPAANREACQELGLLLAGILVGLAGCSTSPSAAAGEDGVRGAEWVEATHGKVAPDTAKAFPESPRELVVRFSTDDWDEIRRAMDSACGEPGTAATCTGSGLDALPIASRWYPVDIETDGQTWAHAGVRLKTNSDLVRAWEEGSRAVPLRLTMDKLEDSFPSIRNQRFYGFQKLELAHPGASLLRHRAAAAVMRAEGIPAPQDGLVHVEIRSGATVVSSSTYDLRELPDNPLLDRFFAQHKGSLYHPSSNLAAFSLSDFQDGDIADYASVQLFVAYLGASSRSTSPAAWRSALDGAFDARGFLKWLAVNTALLNTGGYGYEASGYWLYARSVGTSTVLQWIGSDYDKAFSGSSKAAASVWYPSIEGWPLVSNLLADSAYCADYAGYLRQAVADSIWARAGARIRADAKLLSSADAADSATALLDWIAARRPQVESSRSASACP